MVACIILAFDALQTNNDLSKLLSDKNEELDELLRAEKDKAGTHSSYSLTLLTHSPYSLTLLTHLTHLTHSLTLLTHLTHLLTSW